MQKVLIIEDELLIADLLEATLTDDGFKVCGIARTVSEALRLASLYRPHLAVVDVHLAHAGRGTSVTPVLIAQYNTGILYTTANPGSLVNAAGHVALPKPFRLSDVTLALGVVASIVATGMPNMPLPPGLTLL